MTDNVNMIYVVFGGDAPLRAYQSRGRADLVANRLQRLDKLRVLREWENTNSYCQSFFRNNDYDRFALDNKVYYSVQAVRFSNVF